MLSVIPGYGYTQTIVTGISNDKFTRTFNETTNKEYVQPDDVNLRALHNFKKSFKEAQKVNWYKVKEGYMVYFYYNGNKKACGYDFNGNWLYKLVSYTEEKLPRPIWYQIKSVYYAYSIVWANEIETANKTIYVIHLEDPETSKNIKVCEGAMDVIEEFKKK